MKRKLPKNNEELEQLIGLIETENESMDLHILDYFNPASEKFVNHIEDKAKYLKKYVLLLQEICNNDVASGLLDGIIDEINAIKLELRNSLKGTLESDYSLDSRSQLNQYVNTSNIVFVDLVNRLQRIQRILNMAYTRLTDTSI